MVLIPVLFWVEDGSLTMACLLLCVAIAVTLSSCCPHRPAQPRPHGTVQARQASPVAASLLLMIGYMQNLLLWLCALIWSGGSITRPVTRAPLSRTCPPRCPVISCCLHYESTGYHHCSVSASLAAHPHACGDVAGVAATMPPMLGATRCQSMAWARPLPAFADMSQAGPAPRTHSTVQARTEGRGPVGQKQGVAAHERSLFCLPGAHPTATAMPSSVTAISGC